MKNKAMMFLVEVSKFVEEEGKKRGIAVDTGSLKFNGDHFEIKVKASIVAKDHPNPFLDEDAAKAIPHFVLWGVHLGIEDLLNKIVFNKFEDQYLKFYGYLSDVYNGSPLLWEDLKTGLLVRNGAHQLPFNPEVLSFEEALKRI